MTLNIKRKEHNKVIKAEHPSGYDLKDFNTIMLGKETKHVAYFPGYFLASV